MARCKAEEAVIADCGLRISMTTPVTRELLQQRTRKLAVEAIRLIGDLPRTPPADIIGRQLVRSATSVAANYRSACRARSRRDFIAKMGIVEEEADESEYWLELAVDAGLVDLARVAQLRDDARHIVAITVLSIRRARGTPLAAPHATRRTLGLIGR